MSSNLTDDQVQKFRAIGNAAKTMSAQYKKGEGPDPFSGTTFKNGVPHCTWGQLLDQAGFKPQKGAHTGDNMGALDAFIRGASNFGGTTLLTGTKAVGEVDGLMTSKKVTYDISKIKTIASQVAGLNDPCTTPEARKAATWKKLDELANEIDRVFGEAPEEEQMYFSTAAEQHLQNLIMGTEE